MNSNVFTDKVSGARFFEETKDSLSLNESKNGGLWFSSNSEKYPNGYVTEEAEKILRAAKADGKSFKESICMLTFANIHGVDEETGEEIIVPSLMKTPTPPHVFWSANN